MSLTAIIILILIGIFLFLVEFLLVPGVGAQGGSLKEISRNGMNKECGLIVNSSRSIIYADVTEKFDKVARNKALEIKQEMSFYLKKQKIV